MATPKKAKKAYNTTHLIGASGQSCGFEWSLKKHVQDSDINFGGYTTAIKQILQSSKFERTNKVFPIVFHVIRDDANLLHPSGGVNRDFNVEYLLAWVNFWFGGTSISFKGAEKDPQGNIMTTPGLNIIEGSGVSQQRGNNFYTYNKDFVALDEFADYSQREEIPGVLLEYIQNTYSWDNYKYINIFLINKTNSGNAKVMMTAVHPLTAESINPTLLSAAVDLWAIGRKHDNISSQVPSDPGLVGEEVTLTNFGYRYNPSSNSAIQIEKDEGGLNLGFRARARTIVHSLGHILGLFHIRQALGFRPGDMDACESQGTPSIFYNTSELRGGTIYTDPHTDTENIPTVYQMLNFKDSLNINPCTDNTIFTDAATHMHINQFTGPLGTERGGPGVMFSSEQIDWMHANCEYVIEGDTPGNFDFGILGQILLNTSEVFLPVDTSVDPCEGFVTPTVPNIDTLDQVIVDEFQFYKELINNSIIKKTD